MSQALKSCINQREQVKIQLVNGNEAHSLPSKKLMLTRAELPVARIEYDMKGVNVCLAHWLEISVAKQGGRNPLSNVMSLNSLRKQNNNQRSVIFTFRVVAKHHLIGSAFDQSYNVKRTEIQSKKDDISHNSKI